MRRSMSYQGRMMGVIPTSPKGYCFSIVPIFLFSLKLGCWLKSLVFQINGIKVF